MRPDSIALELQMKVEFEVTKSGSKAANQAIQKLQPKFSWQTIVNFLGSMLWGFLITIGLITVVKGIPEIFRIQPGFALGLGALVVGLCIFFLLRYLMKRTSLMQAGVYGALLRYELLDDRIICWRNDNIKVEILPSAIIRVVAHRGFILIFIAKTHAYYIPLHAFKTEIELNDFFSALKLISGKVSC